MFPEMQESGAKPACVLLLASAWYADVGSLSELLSSGIFSSCIFFFKVPSNIVIAICLCHRCLLTSGLLLLALKTASTAAASICGLATVSAVGFFQLSVTRGQGDLGKKEGGESTSS